MAKRATKKPTVKILEVEPSPCELANVELKSKGFHVEMHPDNFMRLKETYEFWLRGEVSRDDIKEYLIGLNKVRVEFGFGEKNLPNCVSCSFTQREADFKADLYPIYKICMKYYNQKVVIKD